MTKTEYLRSRNVRELLYGYVAEVGIYEEWTWSYRHIVLSFPGRGSEAACPLGESSLRNDWSSFPVTATPWGLTPYSSEG